MSMILQDTKEIRKLLPHEQTKRLHRIDDFKGIASIFWSGEVLSLAHGFVNDTFPGISIYLLSFSLVRDTWLWD